MLESRPRITAEAWQAAPGLGMRRLKERQASFANALLDPGSAIPAGLVAFDGQPSAKRFSVYRNNVVVGLVEALQAAFPVVRRLVGNEFFAAMARIYVAKEPPSSPVMLDYGAGFPDFLGRFEPAMPLPYLRDVARLERAWVEAYHAADMAPLPPLALARVSPDDLPSLRLLLHPSVRIVRSDFPVFAIWKSNVGESGVREISLENHAEEILVARPDGEVEVRTLPLGAGAVIEALLAGASVMDAMKDGLSVDPDFDLANGLAGLVETRIITGFAVQSSHSAEGAA